MVTFDFDPTVQEVFESLYSGIPRVDWKVWLSISSPEEYEEMVLRLSGLNEVSNLWTRVREEVTESRALAVDVEKRIEGSDERDIVFCHTSGTSGGSAAQLKWFQQEFPVVQRTWAPGMQAIFESSGLNQESSPVIFIPSRMAGDGRRDVGDKRVISLYSAEFSQRLMLALLQPRSYLINAYKTATEIPMLALILAMDHVAVVSAPAMTLLKWAELDRLRGGLEASLRRQGDRPFELEEAERLRQEILTKGIERASVEIQAALSAQIRGTTPIFSTTSLSRDQWDAIRAFMHWKPGEERVTNLYVASEIGPFAASLGREGPPGGGEHLMSVFPLSLPCIKHRDTIKPITRTKHLTGELLVTRLTGKGPAINIRTGDVVRVVDQTGLPQISGNILRASFPLKTPMRLSPAIQHSTASPETPRILVGDYFELPTYEVINPRAFVGCLRQQVEIPKDAGIVLYEHELVVPITPGSWCEGKDIHGRVIKCLAELNGNLAQSVEAEDVRVIIVDHDPIEPMEPREELLEQVRRGQKPKGVLKRWPIYVIPGNE